MNEIGKVKGEETEESPSNLDTTIESNTPSMVTATLVNHNHGEEEEEEEEELDTFNEDVDITDDEDDENNNNNTRRSTVHSALGELRECREISAGGSRYLTQRIQAKSFTESRSRIIRSRRKSSREAERRRSSNGSQWSSGSVTGGSNKVSETYITSLIEEIRQAIQMLQRKDGTAMADNETSLLFEPPSLKKLEEMAILIHACLSSDGRKFHSVHHIFAISSGCGPIQLMAACFRNTVNFICDVTNEKTSWWKSPNLLDKYLHNVLFEEEQDDNQESSNKKKVRFPSPSQQDKNSLTLQLCLQVFGFQPNETIQVEVHVLDIFLSGVLMVRILQDLLPTYRLVQILACMEATIPFRGVCSSSNSSSCPLEALYQRLLKISTSQDDDDLKKVDWVDIVQLGADLNNRNLGNFAASDPTYFLDHTWSLLPEQSAALRRSYLYTINDMAQATLQMLKTLERFNNDYDTNMFLSFRGLPPAQEVQEFQNVARRNRTMGICYIKAQLFAVTVIAAFAILTHGNNEDNNEGANVPMSFFIGDLPSHNHTSDRLGQDLDIFHQQQQENLDYYRANKSLLSSPSSVTILNLPPHDVNVYRILNAGREIHQSFDTRNAPLAAYLYAIMGDEGIAAALQDGCCTHPMTRTTSKRLLFDFLPQSVVSSIARDVAKIAISRQEAITDLMEQLEQHYAEQQSKDDDDDDDDDIHPETAAKGITGVLV